MSRISFNDADGQLRWFDPGAAQAAVSEGQNWDGNNWRGACSGLQTSQAVLYLTSSGRWIENADARSEHNGADRYRYLADTEARDWLMRSADAGRETVEAEEALVKFFPELPEEAGPSVGGRPKVGPPINVAYPTELVARIDAAAKRDGLSRAEWLRTLADKHA
jgi:hypothetical protein